MSVRIWKHPDQDNDSFRYQFDGEDGEIFEVTHGRVTGYGVDHVPDDWIEMSSPHYNPNHDDATAWPELPVREPGVASVEVAGVGVHVHVRTDQDDRQRLVVSVDTDSADSMLRYRRDVVTMDVVVAGSRVWTSTGRKTPTLISPEAQFVAAQLAQAVEDKAVADAARGDDGATGTDDATHGIDELAATLAHMVLDPRDTIGPGCFCTDDLPALAQVIATIRHEDGAMQRVLDFVLAVDKGMSDWQFTTNLLLKLDEMVQKLQRDLEEWWGRERPVTFLRRLADLDQLTPEGDAARAHYGSVGGIAERARQVVPAFEAWG